VVRLALFAGCTLLAFASASVARENGMPAVSTVLDQALQTRAARQMDRLQKMMNEVRTENQENDPRVARSVRGLER